MTFSGSAEDSQTTPHNFAVAEQGTVSRDIEWLPSIAGNGEWDQIAAASMASGSGSQIRRAASSAIRTASRLISLRAMCRLVGAGPRWASTGRAGWRARRVRLAPLSFGGA